MIRKFLRNSGLRIALLLMFAASGIGMTIAGHARFNEELASHGAATIGIADYVLSGDFLSAVFKTGKANSCKWLPM